MERVDHATNPLLRPPAQLTDHVYGMGYSWASRSDTCGRHDFPAIQQEMVRVVLYSWGTVALIGSAFGWKDPAERKAPTFIVAR